jgi:hypothetical protein
MRLALPPIVVTLSVKVNIAESLIVDAIAFEIQAGVLMALAVALGVRAGALRIQLFYIRFLDIFPSLPDGPHL